MSWHLAHGNALQRILELEPCSIDALITDPPYSSGGMFRADRATADVHTKYVQTDSKSGAQLPTFSGDSRDQRGWLIWCSLWLAAALEATKPGGVGGLFCDWRQLPTASDALQAGGWVWRGVVAWHKPAARPVQGRFTNACEYFVWGTKGQRTLDGSPLPGFITCNSPRGEDREHITEKPLELMRTLVRIAPPGGVVLDPFMGSGTTGAACAAEGRRFIGFDIDARYVEMARRRIAGPLFADGEPGAAAEGGGLSSTNIEWTDEVWNFLRGCQRVSPGCLNCYAERQAIRQAYPPVTTPEGDHEPAGAYHGLVRSTPSGPRWTGVVRHVDKLLAAPLSWRKPRRVFVNSMSDLFHDAVPFEVLDRAFAVMALTPQHTYQILTKRPARMLAYLTQRRPRVLASEPLTETTLWHVWAAAGEFEDMGRGIVAPWGWQGRGMHNPHEGAGGIGGPWPLPNVWLGVSVEDQQRADERIPLLLQTPASVRWVSYEPALGPVSFERWLWPMHWHWASPYRSPEDARAAGAFAERKPQALVSAHARFLDWIVVGGESGPGARPFHMSWARAVVSECEGQPRARVFVKQLGAHPIDKEWTEEGGALHCTEGPVLRNRKGGDTAEWPADLRVREFPEVRA